MPFGRLTPVDLRSVWANEATVFAPWLSMPENLALISEAIGLELELETREAPKGRHGADILCRTPGSDRLVLIANQLEATDHLHMGKILSYAAGLRASTVIWVAKEFSEEHRAALDWLNSNTGDSLNFFGLIVQVWQIGNSPVAPRFEIACQPNNWERSVREETSVTAPTTSPSEPKLTQLEFWKAFCLHLSSGSVPFPMALPKPMELNWMRFSVGRAGFGLCPIISKYTSEPEGYEMPELRVELIVSNKITASEDWMFLKERQNEIERALGTTLTWVHMRKLYVRRDADWRNPENWPDQHDWLRTQLLAFHRVCGPIIREIPQIQEVS